MNKKLVKRVENQQGKDAGKYWEEVAGEFLEHAETAIPGKRVSSTVFSDPRCNGFIDAPGWCRKKARECQQIGNQKRKAFQAKQLEREKAIAKDLRNKRVNDSF